MEWKDGFTGLSIIVSTLVVVVGWFVARHNDREHEKFKIRLAKTEEIAEAVINRKLSAYDLIEGGRKTSDDEHSTGHKENVLWWHRLFLLVQVYGIEDVQNALHEYDEVLKRGGTVKEQISALNKLKDLLVKSVRSDLGYK
ncbi:MAG TPA: hypothetical protein VMQ76_04525 [Terracidiphilus sp.]|jgi:hypothetical protein|nr:hypothetical protein [Terracidiphilus sp.]